MHGHPYGHGDAVALGWHRDADGLSQVVDPDCPICLMPFVDMVPSDALRSRDAPGRWACVPGRGLASGHALCRECFDSLIAVHPQARCPLCRAVAV